MRSVAAKRHSIAPHDMAQHCGTSQATGVGAAGHVHTAANSREVREVFSFRALAKGSIPSLVSSLPERSNVWSVLLVSSISPRA